MQCWSHRKLCHENSHANINSRKNAKSCSKGKIITRHNLASQEIKVIYPKLVIKLCWEERRRHTGKEIWVRAEISCRITVLFINIETNS